ncbi:MAG: large subunit ribosomal protein L25 [Maribacter sp.]|jgi:large subunit ribosomal protein L25
METIAISGELRAATGTKYAKQNRAAGAVPCVIYGGGENVSFTINPKSVRDLIYTSDFKLAEVTIDGTAHRCILKDAEFHPVTDKLLHMDFLKLVDGHPVKVEVPVRCVGVSPGVKIGGKLQQKLRRLSIKALPEKMVDHLVVDISLLELGDSVRVSDVQIPEGIQIMNPMANPVASVEVPRALRSADDEEGEDEDEDETAAE